MARILITGAHGFIGKHLARHLALEGHQVSGLGHGIWPPIEASKWGIAHWLNGEVQAANLRTLQLRNDPDIVFHLAGGSSVGAAISNPREDFSRTVSGTVELLEWLRLDASKARLLAVSSAAVYGAGHEGPIAEHAMGTPYSPYGHHKRMMEMLCQSYGDTYGLHYRIARLFSVFGPELKKQLLWDICTRLNAGETNIVLGGNGNELRDWTFISDVVRALALLAKVDDAPWSGLTVNVGTGVPTSVKEIAQKVTDAWISASNGMKPSISFSGQSRTGDPFSLVADPKRLEDLGFIWSSVLDEDIASFVRWFRQIAI
ncbi:NAD-dependent epimerase/dehydratase family protein [Herbaspirillum huttiense]|uniref:NAD-dependent epimerase/dehydratase family protein n=1 Tax=Herbaspirillum huttiense TaxID=863372 RepID=UPI0039B0C375